MNADQPMPKPRPGVTDYTSQDMELKLEKMALEREMLAHEREKLLLERDKWQTEREWHERRRAILSPVFGVVITILSGLVGIGIGYLIPRQPTISLDATRVDPALFGVPAAGEGKEPVTYLLMVR